ncbi:hypothetical protein M406DRAFT_95460 [Cryphonectria parasitica EP155]|uniref:Calpain catalytic domain-containing protein n=1 Tax=Cryphonectria parasitica (strain ATCC 38755 / EP155) TaxID=660469 RepID=A0A9P5CMB1_CRYP1|nr:uncharacterized protein M406DRAFT_95460 [Cryphonectria parasitica EP155]KAF3763923.1 hypothetical protein M406DRAFT_95460 [Cryphonectria parasitica EP155]
MSTSSKPFKGPQADINQFWAKFFTKKPSKVTSIFPRLLYASLLPEQPDPRGASSARNAAESYETAARGCRDKVAKIVRECHRTNEKFTDADFDIEADFDGEKNCLNGLEYVEEENVSPPQQPDVNQSGRDESRSRSRSPRGWAQERSRGRRGGVQRGEFYMPGSIHRLDWIFQEPSFTIDGFSSSDIQQGGNGDCWWLAAVATIAHRKDLMNKVCVARDEECGVYGFVFHRDGEWISVVIDDNLYLNACDFGQWTDTYDPTGSKARKYRRQEQTGSEALYFSHCSDPNETWLPLMEKAYAKAHGDYNAIAGGWSGEAVEDMTGGVTTTLANKRVLSKDRLWKELAYGDGDFVFALSALGYASSASGVVLGHAYSILRATEEVDEDGGKVRLVQIRNPWGHRSPSDGLGEWNGRWSDGSSEWTPYWMKKLDYKFGDDGVFWMLYEDMLETFKYLHRTRLFDEKWTVIQQWTSCDVSWITGYSRSSFIIEAKRPGIVVIVLSQLDDRYFTGLAGQYKFGLHFLLRRENEAQGEYICRVRPVHDWENRSVSCEVNLEPGRYEVVPKITAKRDKDEPLIQKLVKQAAESNPQKLRQVGMQYDLAHAKGGIPDEDLRIEAQKAAEKQKERERKKKEKAANIKIEVEEVALHVKNSTGEHKGDQGDEKTDDASKKDEHKKKREDEKKDGKGEGKEEKKEDKDEKDHDDSDSESSDSEADDQERWNAVCVVCLRVYSQDPELTISLVKPGDAEPSSNLVQGKEPAGATM